MPKPADGPRKQPNKTPHEKLYRELTRVDFAVTSALSNLAPTFPMQYMAKHMLDIDLDFDSEMIGISCHMRDYRLCWTLNQLLSINLVKAEEGLYTEHGNYALFTDVCEETRTEMKLLVNQSEHGWFVPEHRQADYVLLLRDNTKWETEELLDLLRSHAQILTAYTIDPNRLKSKENLLLNDL